ncbi:MAG: DUF5063 domain-containing protein [Planctomycetota bacterium]|nr:DUF5063 domain-containing protein [Planctomycetota bacterium]
MDSQSDGIGDVSETADLRTCIEAFLGLLTTDGERGENSEARERELAECLDRLAAAVLAAPPGQVTNDVDAPRPDYEGMRALATKQFPTLGHYVAPDLLPERGEPQPLVGDALDDLADIAMDLTEVVWLWDHGGLSEALFDLHEGFASHWGRHLRGLQAYLHLRRTGWSAG